MYNLNIMTYETRLIVKNEVKELENITPYSYEKYVAFAQKIVDKHPLSYFSLFKGKRFYALWKDICEKTAFLDAYFKPNTATRVYYYINKLDDICHCETCGKAMTKTLSLLKAPSHMFCCNRCAQKHESTVAKTKATKLKNHGDPNYNNMEKNRKTCMKHYGVECSWQAEEVKQKSKQSIREHFGVDHHMRSDEVKEGMKARYKAKHGVEYSWQNPEIKDKIVKTNNEHLGVDYPSQRKDLCTIMHARSNETKKRNYFNDVVLHYDNIEPMFNENDFIYTTGNFYILKWKCKKCGNVFTQEMFRYGFEPRCFKCRPLLTNCCASEAEIELFNFINAIDNSIYECINGNIINWTTLSNRKQLDIVCRRKDNGKIDLAFEFNGLYWHQTSEKPIHYHLNKTIECENLGIRLIHIWEDEWQQNSSNIKDYITQVITGRHINFNDDRLILDRSKFCKLLIPKTYEIIDEIKPSIIKRKDVKNNTFLVEDCGKLICKKKL